MARQLKQHEVAYECRKMGEEKVRLHVSQGGGTPEWLAFAKEWLAGLDHERNVASQSESLEIAKSAKDAAWMAADAARDAAREAKTANIIATVALIAAVIAIAVSILAIFVK
jgi:hypothetical protein